MARAISSLPVPLSPVISTEAVELAMRWTSDTTSRIAGLFAMMLPRPYLSSTSRCNRATFVRSARSASALSATSSSSSISNGLVM
jgi:hypothetical protein